MGGWGSHNQRAELNAPLPRSALACVFGKRGVTSEYLFDYALIERIRAAGGLSLVNLFSPLLLFCLVWF